MKQRHNRTKPLLWVIVAGLTATFGIDTHWAAEDRRHDAQCSPFNHTPLCPHKWAANPSMCKADVALCAGATTQATCLNPNTTFYVVMEDFPQDEVSNSTLTCKQTEGGSSTYTIWAEHTYITSPSRGCYKQVRCKWEPAPASRCVVDYDETGWVYLPKKISYYCQ